MAQRSKRLLVGFGVVVLIAAVGYGGYETVVRPRLLERAKHDLAEAEKRLTDARIEWLKKATEDELKDPASAQFRHVKYFGTYVELKSGKRVQAGGHTICGEVNA